MEHPFIDTTKLKEMKIEELQTKISEIHTKLNFAYSTSNSNLIHQLTMALESYTEALKFQLQSLAKTSEHTDKIDIS